MKYFHLSKQRFSISTLLLVWFIVWGICPWDNSSGAAQALGMAHAGHGHQETDDTHHASKGGEHSCSGSAFLWEVESKWEKGTLKLLSQCDVPVSIVVLFFPYLPHRLPSRLLQAREFSKRFSSLYLINRSLRL